MEAGLKILLGFLCLLASLSFLYRPAWVLRWNEWGRNAIFNDSYVLHYRRRWGLLVFLGAILFFYSGFRNLAVQTVGARGSEYLDIWDAYQAFHGKKYMGTVARCREIIQREPENAHAWILMASAWEAMGKKRQAAASWRRLKEINPDYLSAQHRLTQEISPEAAEVAATP